MRDLSKYVENQLKSVQTDYNKFKTLNKWFKKNIFHIEMFEPSCPECFSKFVIKNGVKEKKLYFYDKVFLEQNTRNENKISITTDLNEKYKPIIEK